MKKATYLEIIIHLLIILFIYAGISKVVDFSLTVDQLSLSPILGPIAKPISVLIPLSEFFMALLLVIPRWRFYGLYASGLLLIVFTIYIATILMFDKTLPCSCGGLLSQMTWNQHIIFNTFFIALAIIGIRLRKQMDRFRPQLCTN